MTEKEQTDAEFTNALFQGLSPIEPSATLRRRIAQIPIEHPQESFSLWPFGKIWQPALGLFALTVLGIVTGGASGVHDGHAVEASIAIPGLSMSPLPSVVNESEADATASDEELDALFSSALFLDFEEEWDDTHPLLVEDEK